MTQIDGEIYLILWIGRINVVKLSILSNVKSLSHVRLFVTPWTVAYRAPRSMGFSRREYWSGLPFPSPGDLPNPGIEPGSPTLQYYPKQSINSVQFLANFQWLFFIEVEQIGNIFIWCNIYNVYSKENSGSFFHPFSPKYYFPFLEVTNITTSLYILGYLKMRLFSHCTVRYAPHISRD